MKMSLKNTGAWAVVALLVVLVIALWVLWDWFTPSSVQPAEPQLASDPARVSAAVAASVVGLWVTNSKGQEAEHDLVGSGLVVDSRGYILTSATLTGNIESLQVIDRAGRKYDAKVVAADKTTHLTLIKANTDNAAPGAFESAQLGDSQEVAEGQRVFALGCRRIPVGWELTTKSGRITDQSQSLVIDREKYRNLIQTDLPLNSEDRGGPLVTSKGQVVGLCLPFLQPPGSTASFGYVVPIDHGKDFLERLPVPQWSDGPAEAVCTWLGAEMVPLNAVIAAQFSVAERRGEVVNQIRNNSPAERAGLRRGDVIVTVNGDRIASRSFFDEMAPRLCQTDRIQLRVLRDGQPKNLTVHWDQAAYTLSGKGSLAEVVFVVLIFTLIYYCVYKNVLDRVVLFVLGAIVTAIAGHHLGFYDQSLVAASLEGKLDVLCVIVGMQLTTGVLEEAGALEYLAKKITLVTGGNTWRIMWLFCLVTYGVSLLVNNLTTIILIAPMVLRLCKHMDCDPKPFLTSLVIASNLGGASTMVGDFPNMLIGAEAGVRFYQFISYMLPICLLELFVLLVYLRLAKPGLFGPTSNGGGLARAAAIVGGPNSREYHESEMLDEDFPQSADAPHGSVDRREFFDSVRDSLPGAITNRKALQRGLVVLGAVAVGFLFSDTMNWSPAVIALAGGIAALAFGGCEPLSLLQKVSIRDILFFSGLFVLAGAAEASGALNYVSKIIVQLSFGNTLVLCLLLMWAGALVTCFLNAGPTAALFLPIVFSFKSAAPHNLYWWALSLGICAGSSGTLVGATAGGVAATMMDKFAKEQGHDQAPSPTEANGKNAKYSKLTFREFAALGLPVMFIFLVISSIYIAMLYRW